MRSELFIATEGMFTGQFVYCGKKGRLQKKFGTRKKKGGEGRGRIS